MFNTLATLVSVLSSLAGNIDSISAKTDFKTCRTAQIFTRSLESMDQT